MVKDDKTRRIVIASAAVTALALVCAIAVPGCVSANVEAMRERVVALEKKADKLERENTRKTGANIEEVTGLSQARIAEDSATIEGVMEAATTWSDFETYTKSRSRIIDVYHVSADSQFLQTFMPAPIEYKNSSGQVRNTIDDAHAVTKFDKAHIYCTDMDGESYTYLVETYADSVVGDVVETTVYTARVTTSDAGVISDIYAIETSK